MVTTISCCEAFVTIPAIFRAKKIAKFENEVKKRKEKEERELQQAKEMQAQELEEIKRKNTAIARRQQNEARRRMKAANEQTLELSIQMKDLNEKNMQDRIEAVLELKDNTRAVNAELATLANKHVEKVKDAKNRLDSQKEELLSQGLNPYVEFRKEEFQKADENKKKKMKAAVEKNKKELAERLDREQKFIEKQEKAKLHALEYEKAHRASQGRHVVEEKNRNFILSRTNGTMEILDPTGRAARVDPSQITTIADHSLGLGQSSRIPEDSVKTIVRQMRATLRMEDDDIGEYKRLVSGLEKAVESDTIEEEHDLFDNADDRSLMLRTQSAPSAPVNATLSRFENNQTMSKYELKQLEVLANEAGVIPGVDRAAVAINLGNETEKNFLLKVATEVEGDLNKNDESLLLSKSPKYKLSTLTKFERDSLDRNIDRHKSRIENGTQQIAGGRLFKGDAFVSKPAELIFKDFEVGKKYRKVFLMTNVSYSFNSFKLLSIEDDYIDFFEVTFTKPGRMSAGVSCSIEILFNPQLNQDIFTNLEFLTETGPVHVPLRALIKRCAPRVTTPLIDFSNVVIGQKVVMPLKITNSQALPSKISIYPVQEEALKASEQIVGSVPEEPETTVDDIDIVTTEFALNEAELLARVRRIMTATERRKKRENPFPLSIIDNGKLSVDGYDSTSIDVVCAPLQVGAINQKFAVVFDGVDEEARSVDENGELITQEQIVTVETTGEEVPIYVLEETLDLKCTLYDRIYRMKVVVCNRKRSAYRVQINILPQYREYVEVNPEMCFVQPNSSQSINVRFTPKRNMMKCLRHFIVPYEDYEAAGLFCLPIEIQVVHFLLSLLCNYQLVNSVLHLGC